MIRVVEKYLIEDIDAVKKLPQFKDIPEFMFDEIIRIDPTFKEGKNNVGKYGKWLLTLYKKDQMFNKFMNAQGEVKENAISAIKRIITRYDELKNDRTKIIENDVMKFKTLQDIQNAINNVQEAELSDRQKSRQAKQNKDYDMVFEGDIYAVFVPKNHAGNMALASLGNSSKAKWCTAADSENGIDMYDKYLKKGGKYYVLINKNDYNEKYQFHFESNQFLNQDNHMGDNYLLPVMMKDKKLIDFFSEEGYSDNEVVKLAVRCVNALNNSTKVPKECIKNATLLSKEEYEEHKDNIPKINRSWWLRSAGNSNYYACVVNIHGALCLDYDVDLTSYGIRPTLILNFKPSDINLKAGDKIEFGGHVFTILSNDLTICDDFIDKGCFREDWGAKDANIYEKSDVKKVVDNWFNKAISEYKTESYKKIHITESLDELDEIDDLDEYEHNPIVDAYLQCKDYSIEDIEDVQYSDDGHQMRIKIQNRNDYDTILDEEVFGEQMYKYILNYPEKVDWFNIIAGIANDICYKFSWRYFKKKLTDCVKEEFQDFDSWYRGEYSSVNAMLRGMIPDNYRFDTGKIENYIDINRLMYNLITEDEDNAKKMVKEIVNDQSNTLIYDLNLDILETIEVDGKIYIIE